MIGLRRSGFRRSGITTFLLAAVASAAVWAFPADASGQSADVDADLLIARSLSNAFERAAEKIERSVVHITTESEIQRYRRDVLGRRYRDGEPELRPSGLGSGVIVDAQGLVLTNHHVIVNGDQLKVKLHDGRQVKAEVVGSDEATDLAVLRIDAGDLEAAPLGDSDALRVGEWVLAVGSPFGFESTVTAGIVSAKGRRLSNRNDEQGIYQEFIQTDAAVNPGNSGGPLINLDGEVVGINSAIYSATRQSAGLSFAIPSSLAEGVMRSIIESGRVERGYLGIGMADLSPEARHDLGLRPDEGVLLDMIEPDGPADAAGLLAGDVVLRINGREVVGGMNRLRNLIALSPPGSDVAVQVLREGKRIVRTARLADRGSAIARALGGERIPEIGVVVRTMTRELSTELGYRRFLPGLLVLGVESGSAASAAGIEEGDILMEIDGRPVDSTDALSERLGSAGEAAQIELVRGRMRGYVEVDLD